jgi:FkbM family methyltransferase
MLLSSAISRQTVYLGDYTALTRLLEGPKIYVDTRDVGIASHLMLEGHWEPWVARVVMSYVKPGMRVCDIGANFGYYTLLMAKAVGQSGRVYSAEINPRMLELLRKSISANGFQNEVTLLDVAAWDSEDTLCFSFDVNYSGGGYVRPRAPGEAETTQHVRAQRLDTLIAGPVDVIKIDIEGAEERALRGLEKTIDASNRLVIVSEFLAGSFADPVAFLEYYAQRGFRIQEITPEGVGRQRSPSEIVAATGSQLSYLLLVRH